MWTAGAAGPAMFELIVWMQNQTSLPLKSTNYYVLHAQPFLSPVFCGRNESIFHLPMIPRHQKDTSSISENQIFQQKYANFWKMPLVKILLL